MKSASSARALDTATLDTFAKDRAISYIRDQAVPHLRAEVDAAGLPILDADGKPKLKSVKKFDRAWVMQDLFNIRYKDEFDYVVAAMRRHMGPEPLAAFDADLAKLPARDDAVFRQLLEQHKPAPFVAAAQ